jgi:hypothetical protein
MHYQPGDLGGQEVTREEAQRRKKPLRVHNKPDENKLRTQPLRSVEQLCAQEGLEKVEQPAVGMNVLHLVRNQAGTATDHFRATLAQCQILEISEQPKVRLPNGSTKRVKLDSLFRRKVA